MNAQGQPAYRYRAFVSYSHRDKAWAGWLHRTLERYVVPRRLVGTATSMGVVPRRLTPIFRDSDELASAHDLGQKVTEALAHAACLVVVCSPDAAQSRWVDEEVRTYQRLGGAERIFCLIVRGEPDASRIDGREALECFPPALRQRYDAEGNIIDDELEPLAADVRRGGDGKADARYKLVAGMLGLELDALKQRDLQRRTRRAVALSAVAAIVMVITTGLAIIATVARRAAVHASHVAERRQHDAEDLVAFMLGDLNDKLAEASRLDLLATVDDRAMAYFQSQATEKVGFRALVQRATTLEKIGSVRQDQGRLDDAMASYKAALMVATQLANDAPRDLPRQLQLAEIQSFIGMVHWRQGHLDDAQRAFASAQLVLTRAESMAPDDDGLRFQQAMLDNNMGHVMEARGTFGDAAVAYRAMLARMQHLAQKDPANADWAESLGAAYNNLGKLALMRGELALAVAHYAADERILDALVRAAPQDANRRDSLLAVQAILGRTQVLAGDITAGAARLQQAVASANELSAVDPTNTVVQEHIALYATQLARLRRLAGDLPVATALTDKAVATFAPLHEGAPENTAWQRGYAEALTEQAWQAEARGDSRTATVRGQFALDLLIPLQAAQPGDRSILLATLGARMAVAAASSKAGDVRAWRESVVADAAAVKSGQGDPRLTALQVDALLALGRRSEAAAGIRQLWAAGYRDPALLSSLRSQHIDYPVNAAFQHELVAATAEGSR